MSFIPESKAVIVAAVITAVAALIAALIMVLGDSGDTKSNSRCTSNNGTTVCSNK